MKGVRIVLIIGAALAALFGLAMIFAPDSMANGFGLEMTDSVRVVFRDLGATLLGLAAINWLARNDAGSPALWAVLAGNAVVQLMEVIVNLANLSQGYLNASAWGGIVLHAALLAAFGYYYFKRPVKA
jgi:hypothetical protein